MKNKNNEFNNTYIFLLLPLLL